MLTFTPLRGLGNANDDYLDCMNEPGADAAVCAAAHPSAAATDATAIASNTPAASTPATTGTAAASANPFSALASGAGTPWLFLLGLVAVGGGLIFILGGGFPKRG